MWKNYLYIHWNGLIQRLGCYKHSDVPTTEMDTVYNQQDVPYIQTFIFENTGLMIGLLKQHKIAKKMSYMMSVYYKIFTCIYITFFC